MQTVNWARIKKKWMMRLDHFWYRSSLGYLFAPLALVFQLCSFLRRYYLQIFVQKRPTVPLIVVGNISVGGVGKTPLVIALAKKFTAAGLVVGIVSRGYGAKRSDYPYEVKPGDQANEVGDEPLLLARKTACPVVIAPHRMAAVSYLIQHHAVDLIISDDGLQHYAMGRSLEIVVIDGFRGLGSALTLPAGPLREPYRRLRTVDLIVVNGADASLFAEHQEKTFRMDLKPVTCYQLKTQEAVPFEHLREPLAAVAGIGHPQRFFNTLNALGLSFQPYVFPDHYLFQKKDFNFPESMIVMTEKDAIKGDEWDLSQIYVLAVEAVLADHFWQNLRSLLRLKGVNLSESSGS